MPFPNSSFARTGRFTDIRPLNRGASGQVYYAKDNLGREVAVKEALPSHQAFQNIREKFEKESRIQASLQHPNIVSIYHLEEDPQTHELYLICEYANGGSLSDELQGHHDHKLTEPEAIKVARDMCAALEETWHHQIVHRDVKPSNILLTKDSQGNIITAKLGDFGIAQDQKMRRTTVLPGTSLPGTPLYAAPEQNDPKNILDVQADIYALGITLWEMLTGVDYKPLLAQTKVPNLRAYNSQTSDGIAEVIRRAVHDDLTQRYQTPQNMAIDLEDVLKRGHLTAHLTQRVSSTNVPTLRVMPPPPIARISRGGLASLILAGVVIAMAAMLFLPGVIAGNTAGSTPTSASDATSALGAAISTATTTGESTRTPSTLPITRTATPAPTRTATLTNTPPPTATHTPSPTIPPEFVPLVKDTGACWVPGDPCNELRLAQGTMYAYRGERTDNYCRIILLPDITGHIAQPWVNCQAIGEPPPTLTPTPRTPTLTPTATPRPVTKIAFASERSGNGNIWVINSDGSGARNVTPGQGADYYPSWSPDGQRIAFTSNRSGNWEIYAVNADGTGLIQLTDNPATDTFPSWSPDGRHIAFVSERDNNSEIYIMNADGSGQPVRLTINDAKDEFPSWSPDSQRIVFASYRDGDSGEIYVMNADGSEQTRLTNNSAEDLIPSWSPDGRHIAFSSNRDDVRTGEIYVMNTDGSDQKRLTVNAANDGHPSWSPDGTRIVFYSERDNGDRELYTMSADGSDQRRLTNQDGDDWFPNWSL